jgi:hypothetical protein
MKKILLTNILMLLAFCANAQSATDRTSYITNPNFESGVNGWVCESLQAQSNSSFTKKSGSVYMEKWVATGNYVGNGSIYQTITQLPIGIYQLTVAAQNLNQSNTSQNCSGVYIYANDQKTDVYTPGDYSVTFTNITGDVEIGFVAKNASGNWIAVDNFRLSQIGEVEKETVMEEVNRLLEEAEKIPTDIIPTHIASALQAAIAAGKLINAASADTDIQQALKDLKATIEKGEFAANLANATPGSGTAPAVTNTNHYVAIGATQALVRATMRGSNILERGVCWSTEHNPTVLDERTTKYFDLKGYIFHIKGLQPATVYYIRPYVMNKTYTVAYGDEVKIVTHPKGTCTGSWNEGAPDAAANQRCREAIQQTIDYFNEWTGIQGFHLSGNYGAETPTADCSYGGWMRIGPNAGNQAIGTVLHETGHGVGVGQHVRWNECEDTRENQGKYGKWLGREANDVLHFLENYYGDEVFFTGDAVHGWGTSSNTSITNATISYDWLVNGADKDKHSELQYIGGMCILHGLFIDGLPPTASNWYTTDQNGIAGYTYNFDDNKKYYLMNKDKDRGLGEGLLYQRASTDIAWKPLLTGEVLSDSAAWYMEFDPQSCLYSFKNASTGKYLTHPTSGNLEVKVLKTSPTKAEKFQLMPDRTDVTINIEGKKNKTHGYWFTWGESSFKSMSAASFSNRRGYGSIPQETFDFSDKATTQQWIILSEDELAAYQQKAIETSISAVNTSDETIVGIYTMDGILLNAFQQGFNIVKYSNGQVKKIFVE